MAQVTASSKLLHNHLLRDAAVVMDIADEQGVHWQKGADKKIIQIGDHWLRHYAHVPHALLFDTWSARAEVRLRRERQATLRLLRADMTFRRWEDRIEAEDIELSYTVRRLIAQLVNNFIDTLIWVATTYEHNGMVDLLRDEYCGRLQ